MSDDDDWESAGVTSLNIAGKKPAVTASWKDEDEAELESTREKTEEEKQVEAANLRKKKELKAKLKEKEENAQRIAIEMQAAMLDPRAAAKRRVEESDFENAQDLFGAEEKGGETFESRKPRKKEDFEDFSRYMVNHLKQHERSVHYVGFVRSLTRDLCLGMKADDVKEVLSYITVLHNEKLKQMKGKKKEKKKPTVKNSDDMENMEEVGEFGDDDFM